MTAFIVKSGHCQVHKLKSPTLLGEVECAIAFRVDEAVLVVAHHQGETFAQVIGIVKLERENLIAFAVDEAK